MELLNALSVKFICGDYYFCHAGVRTGVPLSDQNDNDLLWMRRGFADCDIGFEKVIVHGHTPVVEPELRCHRINSDTGAYLTGRLTAVKLAGRTCEFFQAGSAHGKWDSDLREFGASNEP
jgi:serine/threonine protein phosphatase 1